MLKCVYFNTCLIRIQAKCRNAFLYLSDLIELLTVKNSNDTFGSGDVCTGF